MLNFSGLKIYLSSTSTDMRKGINGLSLAVVSQLELNPLCGHVFVFYNKGCNRLKLLYYDRNGFAMWYKVLEKGRFTIPKIKGSDVSLKLDSRQLEWLLQGLDISKLRGHAELKYTDIY